MNELLITNQVPASITFDKAKAIDDVKSNLTAYYDNEGKFIPLDASKLPQSKKELAALRKVSKEMNDRKITVKKELLIEVVKFENDIKEVISFVKDVENEFNTAIKSSEDTINVARALEITSWVEFKDVEEYITFDNDWLKKKWNDDKKLKLELSLINESITKEIGLIKMLATSHKLDTGKYEKMYKTLDIATVQQRIIDDHVLLTGVKEVEEVIVIDPDEKVMTITRELTGTITQLKILKKYADSINIKWEVTK